MQRNYLSNRTAVGISLGISIVLYAFFILNLYLRNGFTVPTDVVVPPVRLLITMIIVSWGSIFLLLYCLFLINFRVLRYDKLTHKKRLGILVLGNITFTVIYSIGLFSIQSALLANFPQSDIPSIPSPVRWIGLGRDLFLATIVISISHILFLLQKRQQAELRYEALKAENASSRLEAMKNQMNPHFLFNTLSVLDSLVSENTQKAHEYIQKMSLIFRYVLQNKEVVSLSNELDFARNFADIMKIRYGDLLIIDFNIPQKYYEYQIVPMGIQTLLENAIKHNVVSKQSPLVVTVEIIGDETLSVSNNFQPKETSESSLGIGLANLSERYLLKWQKDIVIENTESIFRVSLPLIKP